ncbi:MAG: tetratricopeptide repeat protein [Bacteroidota bacterium]
MKFKTLICSIAISGLFAPVALHAQQEPDSLALAHNEFENNFYEALTQKGIENYDKAITSLQKCLVKDANNPAVYNELGKNYLSLKNYGEAERAFLKAKELDPANRWYWQGLYDVYYETKDYNKSIPVVLKLTEWRKEYYQEDLVSLYMYTQQYDKALTLINEMEQTVGMSDKREMYKLQILSSSKNNGNQKEALEAAIKKDPKNEDNYLDLIYLYSGSNEEKKAEEVARLLEKNIPESDFAHVSMFKFHLNNGSGDKASESMFRVLGSKKIDSKIKHRVLNEFLIYANGNPVYMPNLAKAVTYFDGDKDVNVPKEIGKFFFNKKKYNEAAQYFDVSLQSVPDDIEAIELLLYAYAESGQNDKLVQKASGYIDTYPTQARLYYYAGLGANKLKQYAKAKTWLESGLDFVVEDAELEATLNYQLGEAYGGLGDAKKKLEYQAKAEKLLKNKKAK